MITTAITRPVRVLAYARAHDAQSLAAQSALLRQYVSQHHGWELVTELADCNTRQGVQRVLEEAPAGTYDVLLVHSLSRLSRSVVEISRILARLESSGVTVQSVTEPFDLNGPTGRLVVQVLAAMAEYERRSQRARTAYLRTRTVRCP